MTILVDIVHPADVHFFNLAIRKWEKKGHHVAITAISLSASHVGRRFTMTDPIPQPSHAGERLKSPLHSGSQWAEHTSWGAAPNNPPGCPSRAAADELG